MVRADADGGKGRRVIRSRGNNRNHTFPISFCMIPHRGSTSTRLVGTEGS
jgi:hypothetical protein